LCRAKTPTSDKENVKYLRPWVKKKKAWAQLLMGQMYRDGKSVKQSYEMARRLFELAAQQGDANAMSYLGDMYRKGEGVEQSYEKAFEYYEQAAHIGGGQGQLNLGVMYYNGMGVEKNAVKAREWWNKAAAQGQEDAIKFLNEY
jgi:TPR repeat protein